MRMKAGWNAKVWIGAGALVARASCSTAPAAAQVSVNVFGDVDYQATQDNGNPRRVPAGTTNAFSAPRLELFLTSTQGKLAFLAETMFEVGDANEFGIDMERIEIGYLFSDKFRLRVGRFHTADRLLQRRLSPRPLFPDDGRSADDGALRGRGRADPGALRRRARRRPVRRWAAPATCATTARSPTDAGRSPTRSTNLTDPNNGKMFNLRLRFEPACLDGLIIGGSATYDLISAASCRDRDAPRCRSASMIVGGHVAYLENRIHVIGEYLFISHENAGWTGNTQSAFLELGYDAGKFIPYLRGEWAHFPAETADQRSVLRAERPVPHAREQQVGDRGRQARRCPTISRSSSRGNMPVATIGTHRQDDRDPMRLCFLSEP